MCTFKRIINYALLKKWANVEIKKGDQICTFKRVIKCRILKEWSNVEF